jgi:hypothetical protein
MEVTSEIVATTIEVQRALCQRFIDKYLFV